VLEIITSVIGLFVEAQTRVVSAPSVKQRIASLRHLFDWLVVGQIVPVNPAAAVRGPQHIVKIGRTPVPTRQRRAGYSTASMRQHMQVCATAR
jgi:site-specific recombinase XerC